MRKEPPVNGDEADWCCKRWRWVLCAFKNTTGLGKKVKRAMNKRARRRSRTEIREQEN